MVNKHKYSLKLHLKHNDIYDTYVPPWAKQTLSLGNFSKIPPKIIEQMAVAVSAGMPKETEKTYSFDLNERLAKIEDYFVVFINTCI